MRRLLIATFASLLGAALIASGAQGATEVRSLTLEGEFAGGGPQETQGQVQMGIDYLVKHKGGHEMLIPNRVRSFDYWFVPVSCDQGNTTVTGGTGILDPGFKITKKQFSFTSTTTVPPAPYSTTVQFVGQKMWQGRTKWRPGSPPKPKPPGRKFFWKLASGTVNIIDYSAYPALAANCATNGPRSWSAHQCRMRSTDPVYVPLCRVGGANS